MKAEELGPPTVTPMGLNIILIGAADQTHFHETQLRIPSR